MYMWSQHTSRVFVSTKQYTEQFLCAYTFLCKHTQHTGLGTNNLGFHKDDAASNFDATPGTNLTVFLKLSIGGHVLFDACASKF